MAIEVGKLYSVKANVSQNIGQTARLELRGTVSIDIYGSEDKPATLAEMSLVTTETLTDNSYYALDTLPTYVSFVGTSDIINVGAYELTLIDDIS